MREKEKENTKTDKQGNGNAASGKYNKTLTRLVFGGLFAALITVATMLVRIPTPTKGYINLGDCVVNVAAWVLGGGYGAAAAGIGSALADLFAGYHVYAGATFVIKALMAVCSFYSFRLLTKKLGSYPARIIAAVCAEIVMVGGYALFEAALYGSFGAAAVGIPSNAVQGAVGAILSVTIYEMVISRLHPEKLGLAPNR